MDIYLAALFLTVSQTYNLPPGLLSAVCLVESHHDPKAYTANDGGSLSIGLGQVKLGTARMVGFKGQPSALAKADVNARVAAAILARNLHRYRGSLSCAVAAYNAGVCRVNAKGHIRNLRYVQKVMIAWER